MEDLVALLGVLWALIQEYDEITAIVLGIILAALIASDREHPLNRPLAVGILFGVVVIAPIWRRLLPGMPWYINVTIMIVALYVVYLKCARFFDIKSAVGKSLIRKPWMSDAFKEFDEGNYIQAGEQFERLASAGDPAAQNNLGVLYEAGLPGARNDLLA